MKVLVTGASGFVGNHVVDALVNAGHSAVGLSRTMPKAGRRNPGATYYDGVDVGDASTLKPEHFAGVEAVIHLVGIIQERGEQQTFERIHVEGTRNVVDAAKRAGAVAKFVYVSAIGSSPSAEAQYSRTKAAAEAIVASSGLPYTILRPSIILGADGEFVALMKDLVLHGGLRVNLPFPFIPVPGSGNNKFQPIFVDDLMACVLKSIERNVAVNSVVEIGGGTQVTFNELLTSFATHLGTHKPLLHAPLGLVMAIAPLMMIMPNPPITQDQLKNLKSDNVCDNTLMKATFSLAPLTFEESMERFLPITKPATGSDKEVGYAGSTDAR